MLESYYYMFVLVECLDRGRHWTQAIGMSQVCVPCIVYGAQGAQEVLGCLMAPGSFLTSSLILKLHCTVILLLRIIVLPLLHTSVYSASIACLTVLEEGCY